MPCLMAIHWLRQASNKQVGFLFFFVGILYLVFFPLMYIVGCLHIVIQHRGEPLSNSFLFHRTQAYKTKQIYENKITFFTFIVFFYFYFLGCCDCSGGMASFKLIFRFRLECEDDGDPTEAIVSVGSCGCDCPCPHRLYS